MVERLTGESATPIEHPDIGRFDIRQHSDVMVQRFGESCFVCNNDVAWPLLENPDADPTRTHEALGRPDFFMAFCHYDSGGSYGYAFFEHGRRTRSRLQTTGVPRLPPILESGAPTALERRWLDAPSYLDTEGCDPGEGQRIFYQGNREVQVPESGLTGVILQEVLKARFGVCPWDTDAEPSCQFFRLTSRA